MTMRLRPAVPEARVEGNDNGCVLRRCSTRGSVAEQLVYVTVSLLLIRHSDDDLAIGGVDRVPVERRFY
jgi:hypothetical protein